MNRTTKISIFLASLSLPALSHLYISPLEMCNLNCKMCYTNKVKSILTNDQILDFVNKYNQAVDLKIITFCGGEVFTLKNFPDLVNKLTDYHVQVITNGTVDRLEEINTPNSVNLIVSVDGLEKYHDQNRGAGNWAKSVAFLAKAQKLGFHTEIFSIVTQENFDQIPRLEKEFAGIDITYHPRKLFGEKLKNTDGFSFITPDQWEQLWATKKVFPPKELGCYQISLMASGMVYGCCEGPTPIGKITDDLSELIKKLKIKDGCSYPEFKCNLCPLLALKNEAKQ